jgi:hypothetical protein
MSAPSQRMSELIALQQQFAGVGYIADRSLAAALLLMIDLGRPLLLEGDAGVGKTEVAKALAQVRGARLIRLQCYEGLDAHAAMYEWNYQRQPRDKAARAGRACSVAERSRTLFRALSAEAPAADAIRAKRSVLLIVKSTAPTSSVPARLLSDFQMSIPELGTVTDAGAGGRRRRTARASSPTRCAGAASISPSISSYDKELAIIEARKMPDVGASLARQPSSSSNRCRLDCAEARRAETLDWAARS